MSIPKHVCGFCGATLFGIGTVCGSRECHAKAYDRVLDEVGDFTLPNAGPVGHRRRKKAKRKKRSPHPPSFYGPPADDRLCPQNFFQQLCADCGCKVAVGAYLNSLPSEAVAEMPEGMWGADDRVRCEACDEKAFPDRDGDDGGGSVGFTKEEVRELRARSTAAASPTKREAGWFINRHACKAHFFKTTEGDLDETACGCAWSFSFSGRLTVGETTDICQDCAVNHPPPPTFVAGPTFVVGQRVRSRGGTLLVITGPPDGAGLYPTRFAVLAESSLAGGYSASELLPDVPLWFAPGTKVELLDGGEGTIESINWCVTWDDYLAYVPGHGDYREMGLRPLPHCGFVEWGCDVPYCVCTCSQCAKCRGIEPNSPAPTPVVG